MEYCFIIGGFVFILLVVVVVLLVYLLAFAFAFALCSCSCSCRPPSMCCLRRCVQVLFVWFCGVMFHVVHVVVVMHVHVHLGCVFIQERLHFPTPTPLAPALSG